MVSRPPLPALVSSLLLVLLSPPAHSQPAAAPHSRTSEPPAELPLPQAFRQRIQDRAAIDAYQNRHHRVAPGVIPTPIRRFIPRVQADRYVQVVRPDVPPHIASARQQQTRGQRPSPAFIAPILDRTDNLDTPDSFPSPTSAQASATEWVHRYLASDGILPTLVHAVRLLGPATLTSNPATALDQLRMAGLPVDLLDHFDPPASPANTPASLALVTQIADQLTKGSDPATLARQLARTPFAFQPTHTSFQAAPETGEHPVGLLRMQAGGGWSDGVVPGDAIHAIAQMVNAFPDARFLVSVPAEVAEPFESLARTTWRLRRDTQLILCVDATHPGAWAQDNAKAGALLDSSGNPATLASLAPRYASQGEGHSLFEPGASYAMDGLAAAGHPVLQSPLLFQGGNFLVVHDPCSGDRLLVAGEGEILRNTALGLTPAQVREAFRIEFGVDRCLTLPSVSYHLDFDVSFRAHADDLVALVNDIPAAVRIILGLGIDALQRHGTLSPADAVIAHAERRQGHDLPLLDCLTAAVDRTRKAGQPFSASLSRHFVTSTTDDAAANLQAFLLALDLLEAEQDAPSARTTTHSDRPPYLAALRRMIAAHRSQLEDLHDLGCRIVPIPSLPDLHRGINYLNGIHHADGFAMPAFGGFYTPLDRAAQEAIESAFGAEVPVTPILTAACQRQHGGVHCLAAAYPRMDSRPDLIAPSDTRPSRVAP
ncbi:MAG: hypothetical protein KF833_03100 [Verrucomicrobiae bacterium]|nr:hypothetical protein [Verrucomicrobiae bacterium]